MPLDCCSKCAGYSKPYPVCYDVKCVCHEKLTDNPSSSAPVSKGGEIARQICIPPAGQRYVAQEIDSALASQEARHRQEMEEAKRETEALRVEYARTTAVSEDDAWVFDVPGDDKACVAEYRIRWLRVKMRLEAAEQREREAAEQDEALWRLLMAVHPRHPQPEICAACDVIDSGRLATIRSAPSPVVESKPPRQKLHLDTCAVPNAYFADDGRCTCGLADQIHDLCAPSPVSAPPTRIRRTEADNARLVRGADEGEIALIVFAPGKPGEGGYASVDFGYEDGRFWASFGRFDPAHGFYPGEFVQIATLEDLYHEWDAVLKEIARRKASPVEPGFNPQEPETR